MAVTLTPQPLPQIQRTSKNLYIALAAMQVLDVLLTFLILDNFVQASEQNPIVDFIFNSIGLHVGCALLLILKLGVVHLFYRCQTKVKLISAFYSLVVVNNLVVLGVLVANRM